MSSVKPWKIAKMIKAVLLDLDNTLLSNPDRAFTVEYLRLADDFFFKRWQIESFSQLMIQAVKSMTSDADFTRSNTEIRVQTLLELTDIPLDELQGGLNAFYELDYPKLKNCVKKVEVVNALLDYLNACELAVVIATNPLYPPHAIQQRLHWAGLPSNFEAYAYVSHTDNSHFTKPNPAYYAEIIARVGVEPDETIMVGDSPRNDIYPAQALGLHTFYVNDDGAGDGTLSDFFHFVRDLGMLENLTSNPLKPAMILPQYQGNIGALYGLIAQVKPNFWEQHPDPNEWSIMQILCHLEESEREVQRPRLERIKQEENPFLVSPNAPPGPQTAPCDNDGYRVAKRFVEERLKTIKFIEGLMPEDWQRPARHSIFGPTTLLEMAHFTAQHDRLHLNQLCQTIGGCE